MKCEILSHNQNLQITKIAAVKKKKKMNNSQGFSLFKTERNLTEYTYNSDEKFKPLKPT